MPAVFNCVSLVACNRESLPSSIQSLRSQAQWPIWSEQNETSNDNRVLWTSHFTCLHWFLQALLCNNTVITYRPNQSLITSYFVLQGQITDALLHNCPHLMQTVLFSSVSSHLQTETWIKPETIPTFQIAMLSLTCLITFLLRRRQLASSYLTNVDRM